MGAARCGDVGARDVPRFPERPARDPRRARRRERDGNPRAYRQPGARLGARGDPFLRAVPGAGATLADEEIWRGRGSSGARTYVDALGHPETNLRLAHRVLFVLVLSDPPEPPSPCPPPIARSTDTRPRNCREALLVARVRGSVIHDPATRSERAGVSRDGRHVGRAIARRSTLRARRRVSASLSVEPATWGTSASEKKTTGCCPARPGWSAAKKQFEYRPRPPHEDLAVGGAIGATGAFRTERPWRDLSCGCPTGR